MTPNRVQNSVKSLLMPRDYIFPDPDERSLKNPACWCSAERVLALFNQDSEESAQRLSKKVKKWFEEEAFKLGWHEIEWYPDVATSHEAGCVMRNFTSVSSPPETSNGV